MATQNIEKFFLNSLLRISIAGVAVILIVDALVYPDDQLSIIIDAIVLVACLIAYSIRKKNRTAAVLLIMNALLVTMALQCLLVPENTSTSLSILLVVGFVGSVMLKGRLLWIMHGVTYFLITSVFVIQYMNTSQRLTTNANELSTIAITYIVLYFILTYAAAILKAAYDKLYSSLQISHKELYEKTRQAELQNEALSKAHASLHNFNTHLEQIINERTAKIKVQNDILLKYSYANAHHLRGPVARLLGLAAVARIKSDLNEQFIISKMEEQAREIDDVVKRINCELEMDAVLPLTSDVDKN